MEANLDGTGVTTLVSGKEGNAPFGIAVDGSHVYWTDFNSGTINEANLDGSNPQIVVNDFGGDPYGLLVDSSHIYWAVNMAARTLGYAFVPRISSIRLLLPIDGGRFSVGQVAAALRAACSTWSW
jgi:Low-density lipoprotein receptor repeat class B